jgi:hypothetical protein
LSVIAYVSGHGLGHSSREMEILRRLPDSIPLYVVTKSPAWFWEEEMSRAFSRREKAFDVGCLQTTSLVVDQAATLSAFEIQQAQNKREKQSELNWLTSVNAKVIVTDVASFPLTLAKELGIPSLCVANFTWADIYAEYVGFEKIVALLEEEYATATCLLEAGLSLPMPYFVKRESLGLVARKGENRRAELPYTGRKLALIYAGNWGMPFPWGRLTNFPDWHFLTLTPPLVPVQNLTVLERKAMPHPDLVASVDLVVSKLGYGILGECLVNATPILYPPRVYFAEFAALETAIVDWSGRIPLSEAAFLGLEWAEALANVPKRGEFAPIAAPGGTAIARRIQDFGDF